MIMAENTDMYVYLTDDELTLLIRCLNLAINHPDDFGGDAEQELELLEHVLDRERTKRLGD